FSRLGWTKVSILCVEVDRRSRLKSSGLPEGGSNTLHPRQSHGLGGQDLDRAEKTPPWCLGVRADRLTVSQRRLKLLPRARLFHGPEGSSLANAAAVALKSFITS